MSEICPQCGNDIHATSAEHRCSDFAMPYMQPRSSRPMVMIDPAELATLRKQLAQAEKERDDALKYGRSVVPDFPWDAKHPLPLREMVYALESSIQGITLAHGDREKERNEARAKLATAEADCAAMREALEAIAHGADGLAVPLSAATQFAIKIAQRALTGRPTGQAILDRLAFAEQVCEELLKCGSWSNSFSEIVKFETSEGARHFGNASTRAIAWAHLLDAARKANTGAKQ